MALDSLDPQVQALRAQSAAHGARPLYTMSLEEAREADLASIRAGSGTPEAVHEVTDLVIPGPDGPLPARVYRPAADGPLPVLVYLFGGGWTLGTIDTCDAICRTLTNAVGCVTVSVGYRLAPEHRFPAAVEDSYAGLAWVAAQSGRPGPLHAADPNRIAVGGDSAGGNLSAAVTLLARDRQGPRPVAQLLVYPNTDRDADTPSRRENTDPAFFNDKSVTWYWDHYLDRPEDGRDPLASPLRAKDLSGLPPALVITAEHDPLRDEGEQYAARLRDEGVPVTLTRYPGMIHGFFAMAGTLDAGRRAQEEAAAFLRGAFTTAPSAPPATLAAPATPVTLAAPAPDPVLQGLHASLTDPVLDAMNFLNEVVSRFPEALSFAPGRPWEGDFEPEDLSRHLRAYTDYLERELGWSRDRVRTQLFQYGRTNGVIHELIARALHNDEGIDVPAEAVVVTTGAQEAMLLVLRALFAAPEDTLLISTPAYVGITGAARLLDLRIHAVPEGPEGPEPDAVAAAAAAVRAAGGRPRALYLVPDFANPSGTSMPLDRRRQLLDVAAREDVLLLEDNPYGFFSRTGGTPPTLKALGGRRVVYLGSFSKTALPAARVGYVVADQEVLAPDGSRGLLADGLSKIKSMTTVNTSAISQAVIGGILVESGCRLREANTAATDHYAANMNTLLDALERSFPAAGRDRLGLSWNRPDGGFFLVLNVPFIADVKALERSARDFGVLWTPMDSFFLDGGGSRQLRLSCSALDPERIQEGVRRLAAFIHAQSSAPDA
ncbi:aminotransferase class I/II-fold pyridoxal phosphate-dependent enzyme [Streptomyces sp. NPDC017940]|uniref:aminotransferase class I/II-fold pyridoxal phosphate-dependent enzyme n=1 Tax=Streptomyces sp. NPDC017940 TaxID=3365017 RepID=UPI0037A25498